MLPPASMPCGPPATCMQYRRWGPNRRLGVLLLTQQELLHVLGREAAGVVHRVRVLAVVKPVGGMGGPEAQQRGLQQARPSWR